MPRSARSCSSAAARPSPLAQSDHLHGAPSQIQQQTPDQKARAGALIQAVRDATERFRDPAVAGYEQYALQFGCVSGSDWGAMGLHFINGELVGDGEIDARGPRSCCTSRCRTASCG